VPATKTTPPASSAPATKTAPATKDAQATTHAPAAKDAPNPAPAAPSAAGALGLAWRRLSRGARALVALLATAALTAAVPDVLPYVSDRALDLVDNPPLRVEVVTNGSTAGLFQASERARDESVEALGRPVGPGWVPVADAEQVLTLEGRRSSAVAITGMAVEMVERRAPLTGTLYGVQSQGEKEDTTLEMPLDDPRVVPRGTDGAPFFAAHHLELARGELHVIRIVSWTNQCFCTWRLRMTYHYRGADRTMLIPAADRPPLQLTAAVRPADYQVQYVWNYDGVVVRLDCRTQRAGCAKTNVVPTHTPAP
jgi:hypothetical protein